MIKRLITRKKLIAALADEIARNQRIADTEFYTKNHEALPEYYLNRVDGLKSFAIRLGICKEVYEEAYKIYDFRNSGRSGYTLKDGKIVPIEEDSDDDLPKM